MLVWCRSFLFLLTHWEIASHQAIAGRIYEHLADRRRLIARETVAITIGEKLHTIVNCSMPSHLLQPQRSSRDCRLLHLPIVPPNMCGTATAWSIPAAAPPQLVVAECREDAHEQHQRAALHQQRAARQDQRAALPDQRDQSRSPIQALASVRAQHNRYPNGPMPFSFDVGDF